MKKILVFVVPVIAVVLIIGGVAAFNYINLQVPMQNVLKQDVRNKGVAVTVHYKDYINLKTISYDLQNVGGENSPMDVFRVFMQYAEQMKKSKFDSVELCFRGKIKFKISGSYFNQIGSEYETQNPVYTVRTFPENLELANGVKPFEAREGGIIAVLGAQMEDFNDFHKLWYLLELQK